jgi:hypothetical protein
MATMNMEDWGWNPPESHVESCGCDDCHSFHRDEGIQNFEAECRSCRNELEEEISLGIRCVHGEYIPFTSDPRDKSASPCWITDRECAKCQIDYGPADPSWARRAIELEVVR